MSVIHGIVMSQNTEKVATATKLKLLTERAGLTSYAQVAEALGYAGASSVQRYFDETEYGVNDPLPERLVQRLLESLIDKGCPKITHSDILALGGTYQLTSDGHGREIIELAAFRKSGRHIKVMSLEHAAMIIEGKNKEDFHPVDVVIGNRRLDDDELAVAVDDDAVAPDLPSGSVAIVKKCSVAIPKKLCLIKITLSSPNGEMVVYAIRRYKLTGFDEHGAKVEKYEPDDGAFPAFKAQQAVSIEVKGLITEAWIRKKFL